MTTGSGGPSERSGQEVLDASLALQVERQRLLGAVDGRGRSGHSEVQVLAVGIDRVRTELPSFLAQSRDVVSVSSAPCVSALAAARMANRTLANSGVRLRGWYNIGHGDTGIADLLLSQPWLSASWCRAPMEVKIVDRRRVLIEGPVLDGQRSVLAASGHRVLAAACAYWRAVDRNSVSIQLAECARPLKALSARQRATAVLMADGKTDEQIARRLGVSVRTVRYDIATLMSLLHVRSRFGAGLELGRLGFSHLAEQVM